MPTVEMTEDLQAESDAWERASMEDLADFEAGLDNMTTCPSAGGVANKEHLESGDVIDDA